MQQQYEYAKYKTKKQIEKRLNELSAARKPYLSFILNNTVHKLPAKTQIEIEKIQEEIIYLGNKLLEN